MNDCCCSRSNWLFWPTTIVRALISIFPFQTYHTDIIKALFLGGALVRYPLHFTPFYPSLLLFVRVPSYLSRSLSEDLKRLSIGECRVSGLWFFIPVTETCWNLLIQNERVGLFFFLPIKGDSMESRLACKPEKIRKDPLYLFLFAVILFLFPNDSSEEYFYLNCRRCHCRSLAFISDEKEQSHISVSVSC